MMDSTDEKRNNMERRKFLKVMITAGIGASFLDHLSGLIRFGSVNAEEALPQIDMAVVKGETPDKIVRQAIEKLGGMGRFVNSGDIVFVKPNISWDRVPEQAATTNPVIVAEVVKMCYEAGARRVKVADHTCNEARRCYLRSGIAEAVRKARGMISHPSKNDYKDISIKGEFLSSWPVYTKALEADKIINLPIAKHHNLSKLTMGYKNWMGLLEGNRGKLHENIHRALADLGLIFKPALTILDAYRILTAHGPQGGDLADVKQTGTVIAGVDPVAVDAYGATLFGMKGEELDYLRFAQEMGQGTIDYRKLSVVTPVA